MKPFIVMDCESQKLVDDVPGKWNNVYGQGLSSAVTYDSQSDLYLFWDKDQRDSLCKYLNGKLVVTYNGIHYDSKLLLGDNRIIEPDGSTKNDKYGWFNSDIYAGIWRNILGMDRNQYPELMVAIRKQKFEKHVFDLHSVSQSTLNHTKSGDGAMAPTLFQTGKIFELLQYNMQDVRITRQLFDFIMKYRYIVTGKGDVVQFR